MSPQLSIYDTADFTIQTGAIQEASQNNPPLVWWLLERTVEPVSANRNVGWPQKRQKPPQSESSLSHCAPEVGMAEARVEVQLIPLSFKNKKKTRKKLSDTYWRHNW